jgi:response regulator RpfG family c-di-GMP phosphodiesterase
VNKRILCVDDEPNVLSAYTRCLRSEFELETATDGEKALQIVASWGPFAVIVSDMRMPGMSGLDFLARVRKLAPVSVRMMLTGNSDQQTAMDAVNEGNIFRFLSKPCPPEAFAGALRAGVEQYRLVTAEKELLEETLSGSIKVLTEVLSLVNPVAFGRAVRVRKLVGKLAAAFGVRDAWRMEVAAMLSQIGCVTVPESVLDKAYRGEDLPSDEWQMIERHPQVGSALIARIPRLEEVAEVVAYQQKHFDGQGPPRDGKRGNAIPLDARILKAALDYDCLESRAHGNPDPLARLKGRAGWYDPLVLEALERIARESRPCVRKRAPLGELRPGMVLADDILNANGVVLVAKGQEITETLVHRLQNIAGQGRLREPIAILAPGES